jgi:hypothetical protein
MARRSESGVLFLCRKTVAKAAGLWYDGHEIFGKIKNHRNGEELR